MEIEGPVGHEQKDLKKKIDVEVRKAKKGIVSVGLYRPWHK